jgi:hypothetical protein
MTNPNYKIPKKVETRKYHCTMHGHNDQHDTEHCHIVKQALLAYKESVIKKKILLNPPTTQAQKVTKSLSISNNNHPKLVTKSKATNLSDKTKPKAKANLITSSLNQIIIKDNKIIKKCGICKEAGKSYRAYTTHSNSECQLNTLESSEQQQIVLDDYDEEVEEKQEVTDKIEIDEGEDSEASSIIRNRRKFLKQIIKPTLSTKKI